MEQVEIIWTDKKRYLGMPISFTTYSLSMERLFVRSGAFRVKYEQTMLYRVQDIKATISFWQWFFGVGTVTVISNDKSMPDLKLENIRNPLRVKEMIHQLVEAIRTAKQITPKEFIY